MRAASVPHEHNRVPGGTLAAKARPWVSILSGSPERHGPRRLDADFRPSVDHRFLFGAIHSEQIGGGAHRAVRGGLKVRRRSEPLGKRLVPDFAGLLPSEAAD